ncbi:nucleoporin Nup186/Nup192/Nup205 [Chytridium lagenaria]|nr:nucleoporin Nup186/Nup192/Nup205 [Chytridium lagenaria]
MAMTGCDLKIALFVNCEIDDEICLLAVNILTLLSDSATFNATEPAAGPYGKTNRLVSLLSSHEDSNSIVGGIADINVNLGSESLSHAGLNTDITRDTDLANLLYDNPPTDVMEDLPGFANLIRLAIVDLLITNVHDARPFPTIAHYLLGYNLRKGPLEVEIIDPNTPNGRRACLHVILDILKVEVSVPLFEAHPKLAEKCYELIYRICASRTTSSTTMRYLRTSEDFFFRQLLLFPVEKVEGLDVEDDLAGFSESALRKVASSKLHQRAWLLKLIALELHITTLAGQRSQAQRLLDLLYISPVSSGDGDLQAAGWGFRLRVDRCLRQNAQTPSHGFEQPLTKMLEVLNSVDFTKGAYASGRATTKVGASFVSDVDINKCQRLDEYGKPVYDIRAAHSLLLSRQRLLEKQGTMSVVPDRARMRNETTGILHELLRRNIHIESLNARIHCLKGWCQIVRTTFGSSFELLPAESREEKIYEILDTLFPKMNAADTANDFVEPLSHVTLALLWRLREDRVYQTIIQSSMTMTDPSRQSLRLPVDSLQQVVLKGIIEGILKTGSGSTLRSNHYAALMHFFGYTTPDELEVRDRSHENADADSSLVHSRKGLSSFSLGGREPGTSFTTYQTSLVLGNLRVVNAAGDRFLETVCKDASDGGAGLKTIAFSVLEGLCALSSHEKPNRVVAFMARRNFLGDFVRVTMQREDVGIQALLKNEYSVQLGNLFYAYTFKMDLLLRIAQQREGIEKLLEAGIVDAFTESRFIELRPEIDYVDAQAMDTETSTKSYYHDAIIPILRLLCVIAQNWRDNAQVVGKGLTKDTMIMEQRELTISLLSSLAGCRALLESEIFHNVLLSLGREYIKHLKFESLDSPEGENAARHALNVCRSILSYCDLVTSGEYGRDP